LLATGERYDDPVGSALMDLWIKMSADGGAWATAARPTLAETIAETNLFRPAVERGHTEHRTVAADTAFALEHTRATTLSYDAESSAVFANELRALLADHAEVGLEQRTSATMVQTSS
jgi:hypothetical protein